MHRNSLPWLPQPWEETLLLTDTLFSSPEIRTWRKGIRCSQRTAGHSVSLPNVPPRLIYLSSRELFWQLCARVCELAPYAMQKPILPPPSFKALKKKKILVTSNQDRLCVPTEGVTVCRHSSTALTEKYITIFRGPSVKQKYFLKSVIHFIISQQKDEQWGEKKKQIQHMLYETIYCI